MTIFPLFARLGMLFVLAVASITAHAATPVCPASDCYNLPADSGMINVKDYGAYGDGLHDDTAAINAALTASGNNGIFWQNRIVYLPVGTYLISAPLVKRNADGSFANSMMLMGQSRQATTIRLVDSARTYESPNNPRAMIYTASPSPAGSKGEGQAAYANFLENLTIDTGKNNPGAIAIDYLGTNYGALRRLTINAPAGSGIIGISMQRKYPGPALLQDVNVQGFDVGIAVNQMAYGVTMERITMSKQRIVSLYNAHNMMTVRTLRISDTPTPIMNAQEDGMIVLLGANIWTTQTGAGEAIQNAGSMNIRAVSVRGYASLMGTPAASGVATTLDGIFEGNNKTSGSYQTWSLPLSEPPAPVNTPASNWVSVAQFGAVPNGQGNATAAIRQAFASGVDTIYFPTGTYLVDDNIAVPSTVRRIVGMGSTIMNLPSLRNGFRRDQGLLRIQNNVNPLVIERLGMLDTTGGILLMEALGTQPLVLRDVVAAGGAALYRNPAAGKIYIENFTGSQLVFDGSAGVWLRQASTGGSGSCIVNRGAPLWVFGLKTEGTCTVIDNQNGGKTEMLGGMIATTGPNVTNPAFKNDNGNLLLSYIENSITGGSAYGIHLQNTTAGTVKNVMANSLPSRSMGRIVAFLVSVNLQDSPPATPPATTPPVTTPPVVTQPTTPPVVTEPTTPPVVTQPTTPPVVTQPTTPPVVTQPTTPPVVTEPTTPPVVTPPTQPTPPPVVVPPVVTVPTPPPPALQGMSFGEAFGVNIKRERITKSELDLISAIGIKRVRISLNWYAVEQQFNIYRWNNNLPRDTVADDYATKPTYDYDSFIASLIERKLRPDVTLHEGNFIYAGIVNIAPPGQPADNRLTAPHSPEHIAAFAAFAKAAAQHYKGIYGPNAITWHIWNEPDTDGGYAPKTDPGIVGKLVAQSCEAIRQADPTAEVMGPALGAYGEGDLRYNFIDGMFSQSNPLNCINGLTVHPYRSAVPETAPLDYARVMQHLAPYQPAGKPAVKVAVDEWGYSISKTYGERPSTQLWRNFSGEEQAALMLRMYLTNLAAALPLTVIYDWRDRGTNAYEWEDNFGVMGYNKEEKPALKMFRYVWPLMVDRPLYNTGYTLAGCSTHEHVMSFGAKNGDDMGYSIVWTDAPASANLLVSGGVTQVMDIFGKSQSLTAMNGGQGVKLTGYPLLLRHAANVLPTFGCTSNLASAQ